METNLAGKVAIVTGSARGIGRAYAEGLAAEGAAVLVADILEDEGQATAKAISADGGRAVFQRVDVTDPASVEAMANAAVAEFGGIDILINNAAMFASLRGGNFWDFSPERWDATMAVNVKGPWLCMNAVLPHMQARGGGAIMNQVSIAAFGLRGMLDYAVSKTAVIGLTKNAALELGGMNIRVNGLAPGGVATEANAAISNDPEFKGLAARSKTVQAIGTVIQAEDLVGTMLYLVSDASKLMTGQTVVVDGGRFFMG